jgi:hypothetical protein
MPIPKPAPPKHQPKVPSKDTLELQSQIKTLTTELETERSYPELHIGDEIHFTKGEKVEAIAEVKSITPNGIGDTIELQNIRKVDPNTGEEVAVIVRSRSRFDPPEHLTQKAFATNSALKELRQALEQTKLPIKRNPKRKPVRKQTGEKR